jgi:hypothetical protein
MSLFPGTPEMESRSCPEIVPVVALLLPITWAADIQMTNARPFSISTFQDLSNDTKNASMQVVLGLAVEL